MTKLRPAGIEPATCGLEDCGHVVATVNTTKDLGQSEESQVPTVVPSLSGARPSSDLSPDLTRVVGAWPSLPAVIKAGILALVQAAGGPDA
jgi:hypothetical protein